MLAVRQSTAFETAIGPVLDASGVAVTDCVVGDFKIKKTSGNFAALNGSATLTHVSAGFYDLVLTTSDVDTVGVNVVAIDDTTNTCSPLYMQVIEEAVYDAVFAASAAGYQVPIWAAANSTVNLSATTIKTATDVETDTADIQTRLPAALTAGGFIKADILAISGGADAPTYLQTMVTDYDSGQLNASVSGFNTVQTYVDIGAYVWATAARTLTALDEDSTTLDIDAAVAAAVTAALTTALTEGYRGTGATGSVRDLLYEIIAHLGESAISSTTKTLKKLDGSTTAKTYTLNDAVSPTSITETT